MKTCIPILLVLKAKLRLRYSILLVLSGLSIVSAGLAGDLNKAASPSNNSRPKISLQATISLGDGVFPWAVVVSPNSQTIYVAGGSLNASFVSVIDSQTDTITATIPVANVSSSIGITPDGSTLYVLSLNPAAVFVISTATNAVTATLDVEGEALAVSPNGEEVYVTNGLKGISIINTATNQVDLNAIPTPAGSAAIALNPNGQTAYVGTFSDSVQAIDLATGKLEATIGLPATNGLPSYPTVSPNGKKLYINYGDGGEKLKQNLIKVVDTSTNKAIETIAATKKWQAENYDQAAITPDGKFLYEPLGESEGGEVVMLDTATHKIAYSISLDCYLTAIAVAPTAPFTCAVGVYGNNDEGEVYVIDISPE